MAPCASTCGARKPPSFRCSSAISASPSSAPWCNFRSVGFQTLHPKGTASQLGLCALLSCRWCPPTCGATVALSSNYPTVLTGTDTRGEVDKTLVAGVAHAAGDATAAAGARHALAGRQAAGLRRGGDACHGVPSASNFLGQSQNHILSRAHDDSRAEERCRP